jgi:hypothetical protein
VPADVRTTILNTRHNGSAAAQWTRRDAASVTLRQGFQLSVALKNRSVALKNRHPFNALEMARQFTRDAAHR